MRFSWLQLDNDLMQIELAVDTANTTDGFYVAVGFSEDDLMGDDSVIECSMLGDDSLSLKLSYNINSTTDPTTNGEPTNRRLSETGSEFFLNSSTSSTDGHVYCKAVLNVTGASKAGLFHFDFTQSYYFLMANGPTTSSVRGIIRLQHHVHDVTSAKPLKPSDIVPGFDMDPCGLQKGCFLPLTTNHTINGLAVSYRVLNSSFIVFELLAPSNGDVDVYVAVSFSTNARYTSNRMETACFQRNMSTIECSSLVNGTLSMKFSYSYDSTTNVRIPGEEAIRDQYFTNETAVFQDGQVYCSAVVNVQGSSVSDKIFTYKPGQEYFLLLSTGTTTLDELTSPSDAVGSIYSTKLEQYEEYFDSSSCGIDKECVLPTECYRGASGMEFSYKMMSDSLMRIELFSIATDNNQYVAVGFSDDDHMGNDHVIRMLSSDKSEVQLKNMRSGYFLNNMAMSSDAQLYCTAMVNVSGWSGSDRVFRLNPTQSYYLLLASGNTDAKEKDYSHVKK
ncbi:DOMON domain protein [Ostertagia ostertagi]